jgi:hypothetical protein
MFQIENLKVLYLLPKIKLDYLYENPLDLFKTSNGIVIIISIILFMVSIWQSIYGLIFNYSNRYLKIYLRNNIGRSDRLIRFAIGVIFFIIGFQFWNIFLLAISGFILFESLWGWCAFYAIIGKNTCKIKRKTKPVRK